MTRTTHTTALLTLCLSGSISCAGGGLGGLFASVDDTCIAGGGRGAACAVGA